jgi:hypothetical protein
MKEKNKKTKVIKGTVKGMFSYAYYYLTTGGEPEPATKAREEWDYLLQVHGGVRKEDAFAAMVLQESGSIRDMRDAVDTAKHYRRLWSICNAAETAGLDAEESRTLIMWMQSFHPDIAEAVDVLFIAEMVKRMPNASLETGMVLASLCITHGGAYNLKYSVLKLFTPQALRNEQMAQLIHLADKWERYAINEWPRKDERFDSVSEAEGYLQYYHSKKNLRLTPCVAFEYSGSVKAIADKYDWHLPFNTAELAEIAPTSWAEYAEMMGTNGFKGNSRNLIFVNNCNFYYTRVNFYVEEKSGKVKGIKTNLYDKQGNIVTDAHSNVPAMVKQLETLLLEDFWVKEYPMRDTVTRFIMRDCGDDALIPSLLKGTEWRLPDTLEEITVLGQRGYFGTVSGKLGEHASVSMAYKFARLHASNNPSNDLISRVFLNGKNNAVCVNFKVSRDKLGNPARVEDITYSCIEAHQGRMVQEQGPEVVKLLKAGFMVPKPPKMNTILMGLSVPTDKRVYKEMLRLRRVNNA